MPIAHRDDAFSTMLLTLTLSPDRDEYARPLSPAEFRDLRKRLTGHGFGLGQLQSMDLYALESKAGLSKDEAERIGTLLSRTLPFSLYMERLAEQNIEILTIPDTPYPTRLSDRLGSGAPPALYIAGEPERLSQPAVAFLGQSGVRLSNATRQLVRRLVEEAAALGFCILTGDDLGIMRLAGTECERAGGQLVLGLAGSMRSALKDADIAAQNAVVFSAAHPDAPATPRKTLERNRMLLSLCDAAFVLNADGKRAEGESVTDGFCPYVYALCDPSRKDGGLPRNGQIPLPADFKIADAQDGWLQTRAVQLSMPGL